MVLSAGEPLMISAYDMGIAFSMGFAAVFLGMALYIAGSHYVPAAELALLSLTEVHHRDHCGYGSRSTRSPSPTRSTVAPWCSPGSSSTR